jgi:hypothetical protein
MFKSLYYFLSETSEGGYRFSGFAAFMGLTRHEWMDMHNYSGFAHAALIILHLLHSLDVFPEYPEMLDQERKSSM